MSQTGGARRATAEICWGKDPGAIIWVGQRALQQYWPLLAPHFRDILLPPQRRAEEEIVAWNWLEAADRSSASPSELAAVRKRLSKGLQWFTEGLVGGAGSAAETSGLKSQAAIDQLQSVVETHFSHLVAKSDEDLSAYVCRTDTGLRLHSWGATAATTPSYPDMRQREISGLVLVDDQPAESQDLILESTAGRRIAETTSGRDGRFRFPKVAAGHYRLRVQSDRAEFARGSQSVIVDRDSVTGLEFRGKSTEKQPDASSSIDPVVSADSNRRRRFVWILAIVVPLLAFGAWLWRRPSAPASPSSQRSTTETPTPPASRPSPAKAVVAKKEPPTSSGDAPAAPRLGEAMSPGPSGGDANLMGAGITLRDPHVAPFGPNVRSSQNTVAGTNPATAASKSSSRLSTARNHDVATVEGPGAPHVESETEFVVPVDPSLPPGPTGSPTGAGSLPGGGAGGSLAAGGNSAAAASASPSAANTPSASPTPAPSTPQTASTSVKPEPGSRNDPKKRIAATPPPANSSQTPTSTPIHSETTDAVAADPTVEADNNPPPPAATAATTSSTASATKPTGSGDRIESELVEDVPEIPTEDQHRSRRTQLVHRTTAERPPNTQPSRQTDRPEDKRASAATLTAIKVGDSEKNEAPSARATWVRGVRVRISPWRLRQLGDVILPTEPVSANSHETLDALRARVLREQQAVIPPAFQHPAIKVGCIVEFPASAPLDELRWRSTADFQPVTTRTGHHAEIAWVAGQSTSGGVAALCTGDGRAVAQITLGADGASDFETALEVRAWYRISVGPFPAAPASSGASAARLSWQQGSGQALPPGWRQSATVDAASEDWVEMPLGGTSPASTCTLALMDHSSGWALVGESALTIRNTPSAFAVAPPSTR